MKAGPIKNTEVKRWSAMLAAGMTLSAIAREAGRCAASIAYHIDPGAVDARRRRALRDERLFAACNRALAKAAR